VTRHAHVEAHRQAALVCVARGDHRAGQAPATGAPELGEGTADRSDPAREGELSEEERVFEAVGRALAAGRKERHRDGEVEAGALLAQVSRGHVDHESLRRQRVAIGQQRRLHAHAALLHGGFGQADDVEAGQARGEVDLDLDGEGVDPDEGSCADDGEHGRPSEQAPCRTVERRIPSDSTAAAGVAPGALRRPPGSRQMGGGLRSRSG